jgi:dihydroorotase
VPKRSFHLWIACGVLFVAVLLPFNGELKAGGGKLVAGSLQQAPEFDLLIRNGHLIDARNGIDAVTDVAISGSKIARVAAKIDPALSRRVVDASGFFVVPGLIDIHSHVFFGTEKDAYLSNADAAVPPDSHSFRSGQTTLVDAGGAGWRNFPQFKEQVIDRARTRVLSLINIVGSGMKGGPVEQNLADMDGRLTAMRIKQNPGVIVGVKVAHYSGPEWDPVTRAVEAGRAMNVPVMVDFGGHTPPLSLEDLLLKHLRPGDILTHTYAHVAGRIPIVDEQGVVRPYVVEARKRGVIFDAGHGGGSFLFRQAVPAMKQGFYPDVISTDLHTGSMNSGMKDILNTMSKFLNMGMPLQAVIKANTSRAADVIKRSDLGHLTVGAEADVAVLNLRRGTFGFVDVAGGRLVGDQKLECELTVKGGQVVWDLNGISHRPWTEVPNPSTKK